MTTSQHSQPEGLSHSVLSTSRMIFFFGGGGSFSIIECMPAVQDIIIVLMYILSMYSRVSFRVMIVG